MAALGCGLIAAAMGAARAGMAARKKTPDAKKEADKKLIEKVCAHWPINV